LPAQHLTVSHSEAVVIVPISRVSPFAFGLLFLVPLVHPGSPLWAFPSPFSPELNTQLLRPLFYSCFFSRCRFWPGWWRLIITPPPPTSKLIFFLNGYISFSFPLPFFLSGCCFPLTFLRLLFFLSFSTSSHPFTPPANSPAVGARCPPF